MRDHRAVGHLRAAGRLYPGCWKQFDAFRRDRTSLGDWPEYCYCPLAGAYAIVSGGGAMPQERILDVARLGALAAWRPTQGIYRFDPDLYAALAGSAISGDLPCELLQRLPAWCVYIESSAAERQSGFHGFFAHIEVDANDGREELRLLLDTDEALTPVALHLGPWDLDTALVEMGRVARRNAVRFGKPAVGDTTVFRPFVEPLVSVLLYLCADEADYPRPDWPRPTRTRHGWKLFPPKAASVWEAGTRMGAALRSASARDDGRTEPAAEPTGERRRPRPHVRAAHWHTFLAGPMDGERRRILKWLPPTLVAAEPGAETIAVIRPVESSP
jgi:hypothetical protein